MDAQKRLAADGIEVRVVSMPCTNLFDRQDAAYRARRPCRSGAADRGKTGVTDGFWHKYVGLEGAVVGIDRFGESAPAGELSRHSESRSTVLDAAVRAVPGSASRRQAHDPGGPNKGFPPLN